jgi:hypothetical protein
MLRAALATLHRDPRWWRKVLIGGALLLSVAGAPLAAGMVLESYENSYKGYPTPLPAWHDWGTRAILGLLALLIDFFFFGGPLLLAALLTFCVGTGFVAAGADGSQLFGLAVVLPAIAAGLFLLTMFLLSVSPIARLMYVREGQLEHVLSMYPLRRALARPYRGAYWRARCASLPLYLPVLALALLGWFAAQPAYPGRVLLVLLLAWLAASALLYAHLAVVQLYVAAERGAAQHRK